MNNPIVVHNRLQDLFDTLGIDIWQDAEFTIHPLEEVHSEVRQSPTFRANYYTFVFLKTGRSEYTLDGQSFSAKPRTVYFTNPGHLKSFRLHERCTGHLLTFSEKFLKQNVHPRVFDDFPFLLAETVPPGYLSEEEFTEYRNQEQNRSLGERLDQRKDPAGSSGPAASTLAIYQRGSLPPQVLRTDAL